MKKKTCKKLVTLVGLIFVVIGIVEFEKWMKRRAENCESGFCPMPANTWFTNPFPEEIGPKETTTNQPQVEIENE